MRCEFQAGDFEVALGASTWLDEKGRCKREAEPGQTLCPAHLRVEREEQRRLERWLRDEGQYFDWEKQHLQEAVDEIRGMLTDDEQPVPAEEVLLREAKQAVRNYADDNVRAECWSHAIGEAVNRLVEGA
jgi:glyoxylase-like metal-dependent hydrolase (beta-lactamase superfamily II)